METVTSRKNANVRFLRDFLRKKRMRDEHGVFAVEGDHLCGELVNSGLKVTFSAYTEKAAEKYPETQKKLIEKANSTIVISEDISEYISDTKSSQGLFAIAEKRAEGLPVNARRLVVLDGVQDPGNVGTVIRTAEAFGIDGAVLLSGCADTYSPKTLRAAMGSAFRLPFVSCGAEELTELLNGFAVYGAILDNTAKQLGKVKFPEKTAIVIGSEGRGISPEVAEICNEKIYIPIKGAESLNAAVAASVLLWELSK